MLCRCKQYLVVSTGSALSEKVGRFLIYLIDLVLKGNVSCDSQRHLLLASEVRLIYGYKDIGK